MVTNANLKILVSVMASHFSPFSLEIVQRLRFNSQERKQEETVAAYIAKLRTLSEYCDYGNTLESMGYATGW